MGNFRLVYGNFVDNGLREKKGRSRITSSKIHLNGDHRNAVERRRRIIAHYDAQLPFELLGMEIDRWLRYRFEYIDSPESCIDTIVWDMPSYDYQVDDPPVTRPGKAVVPILGMRGWEEQGIDVLDQLVRETRKRGLEVFWNHRINPIELTPEGKLAMDPDSANPLKTLHPDRVIKTFWWQGMWNLESDAVKRQKTALLREKVERYPFDGIQIDFARNTPCLPPGEQWEKRGHVTAFLRSVRLMLLEVTEERGTPLLLAVRVPKHIEGCHADGFDIEAWVDEELIDIIVPGIRSLHVDVRGFKELTAGKEIGVYPCFDDHHAPDGYEAMPAEFQRGVFTNWLSQGADGISTFNWSCASPETHQKCNVKSLTGISSNRQMYEEAGDLQFMRSRNRYYSVERRGGFDWGEGFFGTNDDAVLPVDLPNADKPARIPIFVFDELGARGEDTGEIELKIVLSNAREGDLFSAIVNGKELRGGTIDHAWKDPQVQADGSGLARLTHPFPAGTLRKGKNGVEVVAVKRMPYFADSVRLEKVEIHVKAASTPP